MDKIKNVLSSGKAHSDETLAGQTTGTKTNVGGLTGEGSHLAQANNAPTGSASGSTSNQTSGITNTACTSGQHHIGRDAAVGAGGVGLVEHEHRKHENERGLGSSTTGSGLGNTQNTNYSPGTTTTGPHSSNLANKADQIVDSENSRNVGNSSVTDTNTIPENHVDRDTAAVGTVGAAGEGIHHHRENERGLSLNTGSSYTGTNPDSSYPTGPVGTSVQGPHKTDTVNRLDSNVNTSGPGFEDAHHHSATHGGGAEAADRHHLGRDTAIGVGGAGLAEHEHHKHHNEPRTGAEATSGIRQSATGQTTTSSGHHLGRDAAVGAGGVGLAEHEHRKHENERGLGSETTSGVASSTTGTSSLPGPAPNTAGPHSKDWMNKLDPRVDSNPAASNTVQTSTLPSGGAGSASEVTTDQTSHHVPRGDGAFASGATSGQASNLAYRGVDPEASADRKSHHLSRDAAVAAGIGGAGYEADRVHRKNEVNDPKTLGTQGHQHIAGQSSTTSSTTTGGPHSSNVANISDPTTHSNASRDHHYGRDAAITGGVGGAAYKAETPRKHDKDLTQAERNARKEHKHELKEEKRDHKAKKGGLLGFLHRDKNKYTPEKEAEFDRQEHEQKTSRKGQDATIGSAVAATGALYSSDRHEYAGENTNTNKPLPTAPGNNGFGTGAGTQNAVADNTSTPGHHYGRDAALGAGAVGTVGIAKHEHNKHHAGSLPFAEKPIGTDLGDKLHGVDRNRGVTGASGLAGKSEATTDQYGNPVPLDAGHRRNDSGYAAGTDNYKTGQYDNTTPSSGLSGSHQTSHHTGRDATALGGAGLVGEHEYRKHEGATGQRFSLTDSNTQGQFQNTNTGSGLTGSNTQPCIAGSNTSGFTGVNEGVDGRNRLHKEPPASHPAAQGNQAPAGGAERENLLSQGQETIDKDIVVTSSHADGGINAASNF